MNDGVDRPMWHPPEKGWIKINFDGTSKGDQGVFRGPILWLVKEWEYPYSRCQKVGRWYK